MRKRACTLAIALLLLAGPVLAAERFDERTDGLRATLAWVLDLIGYGDVERTVPDARQRHGADVVVEGSPAPTERNSEGAGSPTSHGAMIIIKR